MPTEITRSALIADYECDTGEGPLWHPAENRLYWLDIPNGRLFRYDPASGEHEIAYERDGPIGGYTIEPDDRLVLFEEEGRIEVWDDGSTEVLVERLPGETDSRFNDVIADPRGGVFAGTMQQGESPGRLYRFDPDGSHTVIEEGVATSNGLGFTPDLEHLYFTETGEETVYRYRYDRSTGEVSDREILLEFDDAPGHPDGMTVDSMGYLWIAFWDGGRIERRSPDGELDQTFEFPAKKVASVTLAGPDLSTAYATCAGGSNKAEEGDGAGALFGFSAGVRGLPEFRSGLTE